MSRDDRPLPGRIPLEKLPADLREDWIDWLKGRLARKAARAGRPASEGDRFARAMTRSVQGRHYHGAGEEAELGRARRENGPGRSSAAKYPRG